MDELHYTLLRLADLGHLEAYEENLVEGNKKNELVDSSDLLDSFSWVETKQGYEFWHSISKLIDWELREINNF